MKLTSEQRAERLKRHNAKANKHTREMASNKAAAGLKYLQDKVPEAEVAARLAEIPPDTRTLTAKLMGDPICGDPRRPWLRRAI